MKIIIPEEFKNIYWNQILYTARKNKDSFVIFTQEEKNFLDKQFTEIDEDPNKVSFNRFMMSGIIKTKSVNNLLELPESFKDFSERKVSFSFEGKSILVSLV
jgi:hypothetical protein